MLDKMRFLRYKKKIKIIMHFIKMLENSAVNLKFLFLGLDKGAKVCIIEGY